MIKKWREERLCRSEKIPEGSVVRRLLLREKVKGVKKEGMIMEWKRNGGKKDQWKWKREWMKDGCNWDMREEKDYNIEMEKKKWEEMKREEREDRPLKTSDGREVREL